MNEHTTVGLSSDYLQVSIPAERPSTETEQVTQRSDALVIAQSRRNQMLPLDWDHLSKVDLFEIRKLFKKTPRHGLVEPEAMLAIAAILTTGRKLKDLRRMKIAKSEDDLDAPNGTPEGLIWADERAYWRFIAGTAPVNEANLAREKAKREGRSAKRHRAPTKYHYIYMEAEDLVKDCIAKFPAQLSPLKDLGVGARPLFTVRKAQVIDRIQLLLATRRGEGEGRPRASARTYQSLERFLTRAMTHEYGGDLVGAMRLTGRVEASGRTPNYYGETLVRNVVRTARRANSIIRGTDDEEMGWYDEQVVGSEKSPVWFEVRELAEACRRTLIRSAHDPHKRHRALTYQTLALLSFATGHRGMAEDLPSTAAIDPVTGFCKMHDKMVDQADRARMIWVADVARKQIEIYEQHLENLAGLINETDLRELLDQVRGGRLPLFKIVDRRPVRLRYRTLWDDLSADLQLSRPLSPNAGRHWLRSVLSGRCRSDTVSAFLGHWLTGCEPWSFGSCLDPMLYRSELQLRLPDLLWKVRWRARTAKGAVA